MKYKLLTIIAAVILIAGIAGSIFVLNLPKKNAAEIRQDGRVIRTVSLADAKDEVFELKYHGGKNIIEIKDGRIRVREADCPDQTCVRMGWLSSSALPVVCLPHHLEIAFVGDDGGVDAVSQ